jgi:hypothetical protein
MKTTTMLLIGAGALGVLYVTGKGAVKTMCATAPTSLPNALLAAAQSAIAPGTVLTPDQQCELMADQVPMLTTIKVGLVQFWRPITPADLA